MQWDKEAILDIREAITKIISYTANVTFADFSSNDEKQVLSYPGFWLLVKQQKDCLLSLGKIIQIFRGERLQEYLMLLFIRICKSYEIEKNYNQKLNSY